MTQNEVGTVCVYCRNTKTQLRNKGKTISMCSASVHVPEHHLFFCTRPKGHRGSHIACGMTRHRLHVWREK